MARIMAIDYGTKRTGLAVTDPTQTIATALETVNTLETIPFIKKYIVKEQVSDFVIGMPRHLNNTDAAIVPLIEKFILVLEKEFPAIKVNRYDERFTSLMAQRSLIESGQSRKVRRDKSVLDKISATILLQSWLQQQQFQK